MNIQKHTKSRFTVLLVALIVFAATIAFFYFKPADEKKSEPGPTENEAKTQKKAEVSAKKEFVESTAKNDSSTAAPVPIPTSADTITIDTQQSQTEITIMTKLNGYASGTCDISITNLQNMYNKSVAIIYQPTYSICAGYSVPIDTLGKGIWNIQLQVTPTGGSPIIKSQTLEVK